MMQEVPRTGLYPARIERSLESRGAASNDLNMLVCTGGRQRSEAEFRNLYRAAGFRLTRVVPTATGICVMEGERARPRPIPAVDVCWSARRAIEEVPAR